MQPAGHYRLTIQKGPVPGKIYELNKESMIIGRDLKSEVVVNDAEVSRSHTRLIAQADGYTAEDLGSTNGTFVNGQRLAAPRLLHPGDLLSMGETIVLEYGVLSADPAATVVIQSPATVPPPAPAAPPPPPVEAAPAPPKSNRNMIIAVVIAAIVLLCCCCPIISTVITYFVNPGLFKGLF